MIYTLIFSSISAVCASVLLLYSALASPFGPWIEVPLAVALVLLSRLGVSGLSSMRIALATISGGIAGIIASALAFSFPTLYFVSPELFALWLAKPWLGVGFLSVFGSACGLCALWFVHHRLYASYVAMYSFPVGELAYTTINESTLRIAHFSYGIGIVGFGEFMRWFLGYAWSALLVPLSSLMWAVGFTAGVSLIIPLLVGGSLRCVLGYVQQFFIPSMSLDQMLLSLCSGFVLYGAGHTLWGARKMWKAQVSLDFLRGHARSYALGGTVVFGFLVGALHGIGLSWVSAVYVCIGSMLTAHVIVGIAGTTGLAPLGRFATMVMVPGLLFFSWGPVAAVVVSLGVELIGGGAADLMFGKKLALLAAVPPRRVLYAQVLGIVVGSITAALFLWFLGMQGLVGTVLPAQRACARALLISGVRFGTFQGGWMLAGLLSAAILQRIGVAGILALTGILTPLPLLVPLLLGGIVRRFVGHSVTWQTLHAGLFFAGTLCLVLRILV